MCHVCVSFHRSSVRQRHTASDSIDPGRFRLPPPTHTHSPYTHTHTPSPRLNPLYLVTAHKTRSVCIAKSDELIPVSLHKASVQINRDLEARVGRFSPLLPGKLVRCQSGRRYGKGLGSSALHCSCLCNSQAATWVGVGGGGRGNRSHRTITTSSMPVWGNFLII